MAALVQVHANNILDASLGNSGVAQGFTATTFPLKCRLMTSTTSSPTVAGTELGTGGGYVAGTGISGVSFAAAATGTKATNADVTQTNMPAVGSPGIQAIELWDSTATPVRKWYGLLTLAKTTNAGDTFTITTGSLTAVLS